MSEVLKKEYPILWWSLWFNGPYYQDVVTDNCGLPYTCRHTYDRNKYDESKLLVFHDWHEDDLPPLQDVHDSKKAWVLNTAERPQPHSYQKKYIELFTYRYTYHFSSDFIFTYMTAGHEDPHALINLVSRPPLRTLEQKNEYRKTGFHTLESKPLAPMAWIVSNCMATNGRNFMVTRLQKYMDIDIFGHCITNRKWPKRLDGTDMKGEEIASHYKFYLAIENSNCDDYITEKLERAISSGAVPVVDGPKDYSRYKPAEKSFISYDEYGSPEKLAAHLNNLDQDDEAYLEYLAFRSKRTPENTDENGNVRVDNPETFNQDYKTRLSPWFVDNWDLDTTGLPDKTTTDWLSNNGKNTSRGLYGMQWGPDGRGARCGLCRTAHDLAEGITNIDPTKRLSVDTTCEFRKYFYTSWITEFFAYWILLALVVIAALGYLLLTRVGRNRLRYGISRVQMAFKGNKHKRQQDYFELATEERNDAHEL